ncbi:MAG: ATP-binding protein [Endomicrobia bacterium]|nr:ATP-binding protein [Endomicrobiia bacterium]
MKEFVIEAKIENLDTVQDFVAGELATFDCPVKLKTQVAIATEEIFINIARYAYSQNVPEVCSRSERPAPGVGSVAIRITVGDEVIVEFEDSGRPYNPLANEDPDITLGVEEREIGGLGIYMVKKIMDAVRYRYEDNKNILMIKKRVA